jgi:glycosyltransferase involved in cell wall biosynthesis
VLVYFINHSTAPVNLGGAERSMIQLVEDWYATDPEFEALFITKAPRGKFIAAIEERGWAYRAFPFRGWTIQRPNPAASEVAFFARANYRATRDIISLMEARRPDLVVTNTLVAPWGAFAAATLGIPHAWFVREYGDLDHGLVFENGRAHTLEDIGLLSQAVFANSLALKSHLEEYIAEPTITVVYPHLDAASIERLAGEKPESDPFPAGGLKVAVVGRISRTKGQWRAIEAVGTLAKRGILASLCLVGSHEDIAEVRRLSARARELGIADRVTIVGEQSNPFAYVAAADVGVTPSQLEAFGRSTLEYALVGKPAIASQGGGSAELVRPGETGLLFSPDEPTALAAALESYARSPELIDAHGLAARRFSRELLGGEFTNRSAIERMRSITTLRPRRLPNVARYWFALPEYFSSGGLGTAGALRVVATRSAGRVASWMRRPLRSVRGRARGR